MSPKTPPADCPFGDGSVLGQHAEDRVDLAPLEGICEAFHDLSRNLITGHWDALDDDSKWQPWMDI